MNSKTEEIVKSLRGCSADEMDCKNCVAEWGRKYGYCFNSLRLYAADRLEELEKELADERYRHDRLQDWDIARTREQPRWIPVAERLPEDDDDVLIMSSGSISMGYYSIYNEYWADYINVYNSDVTHWMPLPEEPKEDANENAQG